MGAFDPSFLAVGEADLIPVTTLGFDLDLETGVNGEKIRTAFSGGAAHIYLRAHNDSFD